MNSGSRTGKHDPQQRGESTQAFLNHPRGRARNGIALLEPWWNPAVEEQAADRAHRIGQDRPVFVHRLVALGTVEERILQLQQHKREIAAAALAGADTAAGLTRDDLLSLLE